MSEKYDYIIAGAGASGLSLLYGLLSEKSLSKKKILVIDKDKKNKNDRTWCYWEKGEGVFEDIVYHRWKKLIFHSDDFSRTLDLNRYTYKMIRGIDFYNHVLQYARQFQNVTFLNEEIKILKSEKKSAVVVTDKNSYSADYIFNSTNLFNPKIDIGNSLLQHFMGWVIKTPEPAFDENVGTLMDFRINQKAGDTFMYVLPTDSNTALVEYTLFTEKLLDKQEYKNALSHYISHYLNIEQYEIVETEFGIIPMSLARFDRQPTNNMRVYNIGTAGGFTKASSGYTFQFIQKNTSEIIDSLKKDGQLQHTPSFREKVFAWYDRTLLDVIISKKTSGKKVFSIMFQSMQADDILKFLGNETSLWEDVKIMVRLPIISFLVSGIKQLRLF